MSIWVTDPIVLAGGGPITEETITPLVNRLGGLARHVFDVERQLLHDVDPDIGFDGIALILTATDRPRASAYRVGENRAVILSQGLLRRLWRHLAIAAHLPQVMPRAHPLDAPIPDWCHQDQDAPFWEDWTLPEDRNDYFVDIFTQMLSFVICHEIAHHDRGHLDLMRAQRGLALVEDGGPVEAGQGAFLLQDLEFDADAGALNNMLLSMDQKHPFADEWTQEDAVEWGFQLAFAQILVAQVLDPEPDAIRRPDDRHPAPVHRAMNFSNLVFRALHEHVPGDWAAYLDMHDIAWSEASAVAAFRGLPAGQWHGAPIAAGTHDHFHRIEQRYFAVRRRISDMLGVE